MTKLKEKLEKRYFKLMESYKKIVFPYGFRDIPEDESAKATAIFNKAEAIKKQLGYYPKKEIHQRQQEKPVGNWQQLEIFPKDLVQKMLA